MGQGHGQQESKQEGQGDRKGHPYHTTAALSVAFAHRGNITVVYGRGGDVLETSALYGPCPSSLFHVVSAPVLQSHHPVLAPGHGGISRLRARGACSVHARNGSRLRRGYRAGNRTRPPAERRGQTLRDLTAAL